VDVPVRVLKGKDYYFRRGAKWQGARADFFEMAALQAPSVAAGFPGRAAGIGAGREKGQRFVEGWIEVDMPQHRVE
jgi:hypothetical protein